MTSCLLTIDASLVGSLVLMSLVLMLSLTNVVMKTELNGTEG